MTDLTDPIRHPRYDLPEGETFDVTVPPDVAVEFFGATRGPGNSITFEFPSARHAPMADLVFGRYRLGRFVIDAISGHVGEGGTYYAATFRRMENPPPGGTPPAPVDPIDDAVALWIKAQRDVYDRKRSPVAWLALDDLLDTYREHRATGTPLDQDASPTAPGEE